MLDFFTAATPGDFVVAIMLEELGVDYKVKPVGDAGKGLFDAEHARLSPERALPLLISTSQGAEVKAAGLREATTYLIQTATQNDVDLTGDIDFMTNVLQPAVATIAQSGYEAFGAALDRLTERLEGKPYFRGAYGVADMLVYPWLSPHLAHYASQAEADLAQLSAWMERVRRRGQVGRAYQLV